MTHRTLREATDELKKLMDEESEVKISKMIQLLQITKQFTKASDWTGDNEVSDDLISILRLFLVDRDKVVRTQGARAMKYITHNVETFEKLERFNIPFFMSRCLEREDHKYLYERVQSLKWIRHLIELMDCADNEKNNTSTKPNSGMPEKQIQFPRCLAQSIIAIASSSKDEFRHISLDTLRDLSLKDVGIVSQCNGVRVIIDCILDTTLNDSSQSLLLTLLYILDHPNTRKHLRQSLDIQGLFAPFTELDDAKPNPQLTSQQRQQLKEQTEKRRDIAIRTLMTILKSVTGILYIASDAYCLKSLVDLMKLPASLTEILWARKAMFSVLEEILAPISDNKLDNARGPNLMVNYAGLILIAFIKNGLIEALVEVGLRHNIGLPERARALLCKIQLLSARYLPKALCAHISAIPKVINDAAMFSFGAKQAMRYRSLLEMTVSRNFATNMLIELSEPAENDDFEMAADLATAPSTTEDESSKNNGNNKGNGNGNNRRFSKMNKQGGKSEKTQRIVAQTICHRLGPSMDLNSTFIRYRYMMDRDIPTMMFQDKIPFHMHQQSGVNSSNFIKQDFSQFSMRAQRSMILESLKEDQNASSSDINFSKTTVGTYKDFTLWDMDEVWRLLNGPLWHLPNLISAMNKSKLIKRLVQYLKPSRQLFCQLKWSPDFFKHAQCACQLFRLLTSCDEGVQFEYFQQLVAEIFSCLKDQLEANLKKRRPQLAYAPLSRANVQTTLSRVYLVLIGILSESERGIKFFHEHGLLAFLFPLTRKELSELNLTKAGMAGPNDYLLKLLAVNLDYTMEENFRMLISSWSTTGSFYLKKYLISHLEVLYRAQMPRFDEWSINVLAVLLKQETRLALTALKVLEKINLSQGSAKSRSYLVDLINTHPKDEVVGLYGQFLFIKMLSTVEGYRWLKNEQWIDQKRTEWMTTFNRRYTKMLEKALWQSVNNAPISGMSGDNNDGSEMSDEQQPDKSGNENDTKLNEEAIDWLPHHLIHEHKTDEEELYHEYLTHFPWILSIIVKRPSGQEVNLTTDCFFDYNCFTPPKTGYKFPVSMGPGIHALILDQFGIPKPFHVGKNDSLKISLSIGADCLDSIYSKKSLEKWVKMGENLKKINKDCSVINIDQVTLFFQPAQLSDDANGDSATTTHSLRANSLYKQDDSGVHKGSFGNNSSHTFLQRVFFSVKEIQKSHSLVRPLPHFYGELAKTTQGCNYIKSQGDLNEFVSKVDNCDDSLLESENANLDLRASLWALGMIGSSVPGLTLLSETNVVRKVAYMAKYCQTLSVRGTCLYVLGLFSRTKQGMNQLSRCGFDFPADNIELDLAVAIPRNLDEFFQIDNKPMNMKDMLAKERKLGHRRGLISQDNGENINDKRHLSSIDESSAGDHESKENKNDDSDMDDSNEVKTWPNDDKLNKVSVSSPPHLARPMNMKPMDPNELLGKAGHSEETVLAHVSALCNNVTQKSSGGALHKLRQKKPTVFSNPLLLRECVKLLIAYNFKLPARRFVLFNLFDMCLLDSSTMDVWNESLSDPILPHKEIRQWRYHYKQIMLDKKRAAQRGYGGGHGSHGGHGGKNDVVSSMTSSNSGNRKYSKKPNFKQFGHGHGPLPKVQEQKEQTHDKTSYQLNASNSSNGNNDNNNDNNDDLNMGVTKSRSSTIKSDVIANISPTIRPKDVPSISPAKPTPVLVTSQTKRTPSPPNPQHSKNGMKSSGNNSNENEEKSNGIEVANGPLPPPAEMSPMTSRMSDDEEEDDEHNNMIMGADETPFGGADHDVPMSVPGGKKQLRQQQRNAGGSLPKLPQRFGDEMADSPTKNVLGPNPLAMD